MKLLLTSGGITNTSIGDALVDLLGKPVADSTALCIPTARWGYPLAEPPSAHDFVSGRAWGGMTSLDWRSLGVLELCTLPEDLAGRLEGKSSLGRLGLLTHSTAGFIDPGFSGHITLELSNVANLPITLWPGMKIGQLCILRLTSPAEHPYGSASVGSKYQGQRGPTPSRSYQNFIRST